MYCLPLVSWNFARTIKVSSAIFSSMLPSAVLVCNWLTEGRSKAEWLQIAYNFHKACSLQATNHLTRTMEVCYVVHLMQHLQQESMVLVLRAGIAVCPETSCQTAWEGVWSHTQHKSCIDSGCTAGGEQCSWSSGRGKSSWHAPHRILWRPFKRPMHREETASRLRGGVNESISRDRRRDLILSVDWE